MIRKNELIYANLPLALTAIVPEALFLTAFDDVESKNVVVWCVDSLSNRQREIEYSPKLGRLLSRAERESKLPIERVIVLSGDGIKVRIGNRLEPGTDVRYETYVAYDPITSAKLAEGEQIFYESIMLEPEEVIRPEIQKASFPSNYSKWSAVERIRYWVGVLYRIRRQTGESGINEDQAFRPELLKQMRAVDSGIDGILPTILAELGRMEMVAPDVMRAAFNQRTGASI